MMVEPAEPNIGARVRGLRQRQGLSLRALARRSGLSLNAVTQIERGESSPTVSSLHLLASALGISIASLFQDEQNMEALFVRPQERLRTATVRGVTMASLGLGLRDQQLIPFLVTLAADQESHDKAVTHAGAEFVYCLVGQVTYVINGQSFVLEPGCSLIFNATQPHFFHNESQASAEILLIFCGHGEAHQAQRLHLGASSDSATEAGVAV